MSYKEDWKKADEREICIAELLWKMVYGWRGIFICILVFALLFASYQYVKDTKASNVTNSPIGISLESLQESLTEDEKDAISQARLLEKQLESRMKYQEESILMNIDSYAKNVVTLQYYVDTNYIINLDRDIPKDYTDELVALYVAYIRSFGMSNAVLEQLNWGVDIEYIGELISINESISGAEASFSIYITGADLNYAEELADVVTASIDKYQAKLNAEIGAHELTLVDRYNSIELDEALTTAQMSLVNTITTLRTSLTTIQNGFTNNQMQVFREDIIEPTISSTELSVSISKKMILIGACIGLLFSCGWIAICYILNNSIRSLQELQNIYNVRLLGSLKKKKKKQIFSMVDHWIDILRHKESWTEDELLELVITNIIISCKQEGILKVFMTTSLHMMDDEKIIITILQNELQKRGIEVVFGENVIHNAKSLELMSEIAVVILVEEIGVTKYTSVEQELILCTDQKAKILGVIGIESE